MDNGQLHENSRELSFSRVTRLLIVSFTEIAFDAGARSLHGLFHFRTPLSFWYLFHAQKYISQSVGRHAQNC